MEECFRLPKEGPVGSFSQSLRKMGHLGGVLLRAGKDGWTTAVKLLEVVTIRESSISGSLLNQAILQE
jgi:hypothetical protein